MKLQNLFIAILAILLPLSADAEDGKVRVACVGNSITEGFALDNPKTESYPAVLQRLLGDGYEVGNFGLTAHTLMMAGDLPYMKKRRFQSALAFNPDIVTIKLGTNDTKPWNWQHKATFKDDLNKLIDAFDTLPTHPRIYLCLPVPADHREWGINDSTMVNGVIPRIREVAAERGLAVIDLHTPMLSYHPLCYTDGVHPDKYGAAIVAAEIYKALTGKDAPTDMRPDQMLWFDRPARQWEETLPVGNGRMGMMPDGGIATEHIVLNEISMWSGSEADYRNPDAAKSLPQIRRLLFEGKNKEAQELMYTNFVPKKPEQGGTYGAFQMLADMRIDYAYPDAITSQPPLTPPVGEDWYPNPRRAIKAPPQGGVEGAYRRWLDLGESVAYTDFTLGGTHYVREYFASRDKDVLLVRLSADRPRSVSFTMSLSRPERGSVKAVGDALLEISGTLDSGNPDKAGVRYSAVAGVVADGGSVVTGQSSVTVTSADEVWIVVSAATSFLAGEVYRTEAMRLFEAAASSDLSKAKAEAVASYQRLYNRAGVFLPENAAVSQLPTDRRLAAFQQQDDPSLAALYYNYGRYLLISSTRPGSLPPNLQGLWANEPGTPWNGDYHTNINVQMNHWPVEPANLSELHLPLVGLVGRLVESGEESAKAFYGDGARGWVLHMMTNVWNYTAPGEHPSWGATNTGGAWLCAHLWEHYLYTGDKRYLSGVYPVMKGAADFFLSTMVREPRHGWLVTAPTSSPENSFYLPGGDKTPISVCMGPTMDTQLVRELFANVIAAAAELGVDGGYADTLAAAIGMLPPHQTGKDGRLMEWLEDYEETDPHHRHVSHLYGLHPGNQITPTATPLLAEACRKTLDRRGDGGTGWSRAWKINFWARLGDGARAYALFKSLLHPAYTEDGPTRHGSGTFPNLFCSHPPFQIDGNWGGTSGISEMLLQSHEGFVNLLPAIPQTWGEGRLAGFKVRGGATVGCKWSGGRPTEVTLTGGWQPQLRLKTPQGTVRILVDGKAVENADYITLNLENGQTATVKFEYTGQ